MANRKYLIVPGQRFGKLVVIQEFYIFRHGRQERMVKCLCDCGKETVQRIVNIFTTVSSCGCNRGKNKGIKGHGYSKTSIYHIYLRMVFRCYNKNNKDYKYYGERGISVYKEWIDNPKLFCEWAFKNGYQKGLTIERIDNNKNYTPENCTFITRARQVNNMRSNIIIDYQNEKMSMADFCHKYNLRYQRFHDRIIKLNWTIEKAILNCN